MAKSKRMVWRKRILLGILAALSGLFAGVIVPSLGVGGTSSLHIPWVSLRPIAPTAPSPVAPAHHTPHRLSYQVTQPVVSQLRLERNVNQNVFPIKTGIAQRVEDFRTAIAQKQTEKEQLITFGVPASFQGTIVRDAPLSGNQKVVALTFDDGPWPDTLQILEILEQNNIKATFFWIGKHLQIYPQIAQQVAHQGHAIGNHTWSHPYHPVDRTTAAKEIEDTAAVIYNTTGVTTSMFRPPGGVLDNGLADYAQSQNYAVTIWSVDSGESKPGVTAQSLVNKVVKSTQPGSIVLLHDGGGNRSMTVQALPQIVEELRNRGYNFVTLPQLLEMQEEESLFPTAENLASPSGGTPDPI